MKKSIHLVSFDVPLPANYGGVIDVFYKIKAMHALNIHIILHVFQNGKSKRPELLELCESVHYYRRNSFFSSMVSTEFPFIVKSRGNEMLLNNLNKDSNPILFDGLHTTYILNLHNFGCRKIFLRAHNIEHLFYKGLARSESNILKRFFYNKEAEKLKKYEKILTKIQGVFSISKIEQEYFKKKYGDKCIYIPAFHDTEKHTSNRPRGKFILYHGNLKVSENVKASLFLIDIYKQSDYELVIASSYKDSKVIKEISKHSNIYFNALVEENDLIILFDKAHINVLPTFQNTGIKLKLLNTLYQGKFIIANNFMIDQTGLESLCERATTKTDFLNKTEELFKKDFKNSFVKERKKILQNFNPENSARKIIDIIFNH
tara:strand:+ start:9877 stop:10998 length:1122 start_codon:yes stop_codon:yes gene_type:complete